jgi:hypothetical protein
MQRHLIVAAYIRGESRKQLTGKGFSSLMHCYELKPVSDSGTGTFEKPGSS